MSTDDANTETDSTEDEFDRIEDALIAFFDRYYEDEIATLAQRYPSEQQALEIDWSDLNEFDPDMADDYRKNPDLMQDHANQALTWYDLPADVDLTGAEVRVRNLPDSHTHIVGDYSPSDIFGTLRGIHGQVAKVSQTNPVITHASFECVRCGVKTDVPQQTEDFQEPYQCSGCDRQGPFSIDYEDCEFKDYQRIRLTPPPEHADGTDADFDVVLEEDLTDQVQPGDRVIINAIIRLEKKGGDGGSVVETYGEGMSIEHQDTTMDDINPAEYADEIDEIAESDDPLERIVDSIAPSHYGDRLVKTALALQLFGGVDATLPDGGNKRGTPHIFLVGDPGCGKSQLLQYVTDLEPRSVFTSGTGSSSAGLTASAVRDDFSDSEWSLEAGALVEANDGLAAIDELDKMEEGDKAGLYEAMSDQSVSVAKAGISTTLPARTKVLAAANPEYGRFDDYEPIGEQIDLDPVLLSRFDLIFTLSDDGNEEKDRELANHLNEVAKTAQHTVRTGSTPEDSVAPEISVEVLRAYVSKAREITPELTDEASELITESYVEIRGANDDDGPVPVTARDIGAMHRLSEAAARTRLSERIEEQDVRTALRVRRACLADIGIDPETGEFDVDVIETGQSKTQRDRVKSLKDLIRELQAENDDDVAGAPREEIIDAATDAGMDESKVEHEMQKLRDAGELYNPDRDHLRLVD